MRYKSPIFLFILLLFPVLAYCQSQVQVVYADSLNGIQVESSIIMKLIGKVVLRQGTTTLTCDQAILNSTTNNVEAYGRVKIIQADTVTITGDSALYNGDLRQAYMLGRVKLDDHTIVLNTNKLDLILDDCLNYHP